MRIADCGLRIESRIRATFANSIRIPHSANPQSTIRIPHSAMDGGMSHAHEVSTSFSKRNPSMKRTCAGVVIVCAIAFSSAGIAQERVSHPGAGIELVRPAGWHTATLAQVQANRERVRLPDPELQHALQTRSALPLFAFTKHPEPHAGLNPSVQVTLRSALNGTPTELLTTALQPLRRAFADFRLVSPVRATDVSGWPAAHMTATYTLTSNAGASFPVRSRMWLVPRGSLMFLIGMSGSATGDDLCEGEFKAVLASIVIQK
jgi:hypothetical protein